MTRSRKLFIWRINIIEPDPEAFSSGGIRLPPGAATLNALIPMSLLLAVDGRTTSSHLGRTRRHPRPKWPKWACQSTNLRKGVLDPYTSNGVYFDHGEILRSAPGSNCRLEPESIRD